MAQQVNVKFVDDLDGSDAAATVSFGLDGTAYEIDLSDDNAAKLRDSLAVFVGAARSKSGGSTYLQRGHGLPPTTIVSTVITSIAGATTAGSQWNPSWLRTRARNAAGSMIRGSKRRICAWAVVVSSWSRRSETTLRWVAFSLGAVQGCITLRSRSTTSPMLCAHS